METREKLLIIAAEDFTQSDSIVRVLNGLGYCVDTRRQITSFDANYFHTYNMLVLLIGSNKSQLNKIISLIRSYSKIPMLVIVENRLELDEECVLCYCDELIEWPCQKDELGYQLTKLESISNIGNVVNPGGLDEFVKLNLLGGSKTFLNTLDKIKKYSKTDACVLIEGETGTGKELAARAIHYISDRNNQPFIPVNCGALPDTLIENELFGHEKGAYTDAKQQQQGLLEQASNGTLFLDEVNSLSTKAQITLLRFLQDQRFLPIGSQKFKQVNVRVVAATNQSLEKMVKSGQFRQDLYFRLNILYVYMPSLSDRKGDEILLANEFMCRYRTLYNDSNKVLHNNLIEWIGKHDWPGNVRELENLIHREFLLAEGLYVGRDLITNHAIENRRENGDRRHNELFNIPFQEAKCKVIAEFETAYLDSLMKKYNGNVTLAAKKAGKERRALGKLLMKYSIIKRKMTLENT